MWTPCFGEPHMTLGRASYYHSFRKGIINHWGQSAHSQEENSILNVKLFLQWKEQALGYCPSLAAVRFKWMNTYRVLWIVPSWMLCVTLGAQQALHKGLLDEGINGGAEIWQSQAASPRSHGSDLVAQQWQKSLSLLPHLWDRDSVAQAALELIPLCSGFWVLGWQMGTLSSFWTLCYRDLRSVW